MGLYNVKCPVCGTLNCDLMLEETKGWMECECCKAVTLVYHPKKMQSVGTSFPQVLDAALAIR